MDSDKIKFVLQFLEDNKNNFECLQINVKNLEKLKNELKKNKSNVVECIFCEWSREEIEFILKKYKKALKELKIKEKEKKLCFKI